MKTKLTNKKGLIESKLVKIILVIIFIIVMAIIITQIRGNILSTWGLLL